MEELFLYSNGDFLILSFLLHLLDVFYSKEEDFLLLCIFYLIWLLKLVPLSFWHDTHLFFFFEYFLTLWHKMFQAHLIFSLHKTCNRPFLKGTLVSFSWGTQFRNQNLVYCMCSLLLGYMCFQALSVDRGRNRNTYIYTYILRYN